MLQYHENQLEYRIFASSLADTKLLADFIATTEVPFYNEFAIKFNIINSRAYTQEEKEILANDLITFIDEITKITKADS